MNSSHKQVHVWAKMCVRGVSECLDRPTHRCKTYRQELGTVHSPEQPYFTSSGFLTNRLADFPPKKGLITVQSLNTIFMNVYKLPQIQHLI